MVNSSTMSSVVNFSQYSANRLLILLSMTSRQAASALKLRKNTEHKRVNLALRWRVFRRKFLYCKINSVKYFTDIPAYLAVIFWDIPLQKYPWFFIWNNFLFENNYDFYMGVHRLKSSNISSFNAEEFLRILLSKSASWSDRKVNMELNWWKNWITKIP